MANFVVVKIPGQKQPRIYYFESPIEASDMELDAFDKGYEAKVYPVGTNDIRVAKQHLRNRVASDFGMETSGRNFMRAKVRRGGM